MTLRNGVMVAQLSLEQSVLVRVQVSEPNNGAMVKRLRRRPLKAKSRVRFSLALPTKKWAVSDRYSSFFIAFAEIVV